MSTTRHASPRIALLSEHVRNQIAAGEVIERPASVVKELVENALDAGAQNVRVELEQGGLELVRVVDDGSGMGAADLALAFLPHSTSKLREPGDLDHIASLGFRGEALAAIGSVARCRLFSRPRGMPEGELHGFAIENLGGQLGRAAEAGGEYGTSVEARELFFNAPARRRFQKSVSAELARCLDVVQRLALAHEGVGFRVVHEGRLAFDVESAMSFLDRLRRTYGADLAKELLPVEAREGSLVLSGHLGPPRLARGDATRQIWLVNGRALRDKLLARVLKDAYRGFLDGPRHPIAFLRLALDPAEIDVNVHPAKAEVRFRDERRVFGFLLASLRAALTRADLAQPGAELVKRALASEARPSAGLYSSGGRGASTAGEALAAFAASPPGASSRAAAERIGSEPLGSPLRDVAGPPRAVAGPIGAPPFVQIARTYILRALPDGFEVIDQHAFHERVTFEGLKRDLESGRIEVQRYLVPELVELSRAEVELLSSAADDLRRAGIELERFGDTTIAVHGLPARLRKPAPAAIVLDAVAALAERGRAPRTAEVLEEVLHRAACRSSVMAGDELDASEMQALLEQGARLESDQTCVHGRPTRVRFTLADLERAFHRR